ncbi:PH (Pleckstrin Homology) domain-containing protein [Thermosporothrix hazakensis]|uniref:PH (Pleckstrin Homology) domain-containing protein n=2 Tax=Thermosporothrix TaxID=768650 RepID=A0A326UAY0_THEHA|nr:PH domain-containing protein [Thermosporothrix hazakensis]PZW34361.1 PH (Pleckstrin Homology) domain-containing protein [Thermosporothrix hazakensis]BBH85483.1 hypothetical protein KTC_02340 [Thermosporothrix sp. COM3]GCE46090.1 hypothetical protein KTH_09590 [Thermosporothrix hazakensis]
MVDFQQGFIKLSPIPPQQVMSLVGPMLVADEQIIAAFKSIRDSVVFTNKRILAINVQGITGKKIDYTSLPYSKVQAFSIETAGVLDRDCELELYYSAVGKVKFEIRGSFDIVGFNRILSQYVL